jgi:hypothetical protein
MDSNGLMDKTSPAYRDAGFESCGNACQTMAIQQYGEAPMWSFEPSGVTYTPSPCMQSLNHCPLFKMRLARITPSKQIRNKTTPEYATVAKFHHTLSLVCDVTNKITKDKAALACILSFWNSPEYMRCSVNDCLESAPKVESFADDAKRQEAIH